MRRALRRNPNPFFETQKSRVDRRCVFQMLCCAMLDCRSKGNRKKIEGGTINSYPEAKPTLAGIWFVLLGGRRIRGLRREEHARSAVQAYVLCPEVSTEPCAPLLAPEFKLTPSKSMAVMGQLTRCIQTIHGLRTSAHVPGGIESRIRSRCSSAGDRSCLPTVPLTADVAPPTTPRPRGARAPWQLRYWKWHPCLRFHLKR